MIPPVWCRSIVGVVTAEEKRRVLVVISRVNGKGRVGWPRVRGPRHGKNSRVVSPHEPVAGSIWFRSDYP